MLTAFLLPANPLKAFIIMPATGNPEPSAAPVARSLCVLRVQRKKGKTCKILARCKGRRTRVSVVMRRKKGQDIE